MRLLKKETIARQLIKLYQLWEKDSYSETVPMRTLIYQSFTEHWDKKIKAQYYIKILEELRTEYNNMSHDEFIKKYSKSKK